MEHDGTIIPCTKGDEPAQDCLRFYRLLTNLTAYNHPSFPYHTRGTCEAAKHWSDLLWSLAFSTWRIIFISIGRGLSYFFGVQPYLLTEQQIQPTHLPNNLMTHESALLGFFLSVAPASSGPTTVHNKQHHPTSQIFGILANPD